MAGLRASGGEPMPGETDKSCRGRFDLRPRVLSLGFPRDASAQVRESDRSRYEALAGAFLERSMLGLLTPNVAFGMNPVVTGGQLVARASVSTAIITQAYVPIAVNRCCRRSRNWSSAGAPFDMIRRAWRLRTMVPTR